MDRKLAESVGAAMPVPVDWGPERSIERLRSTVRRSLSDVVIDAAIAAGDQVMSALSGGVSDEDAAKHLATARDSLEIADRYLRLLRNDFRADKACPDEVPF